MPPELADAFARLRQLELLTDRRQHRQHAVRRASGRLLLACVLEGWRVTELLHPAGIGHRTANYRIAEARQRGGQVGLMVPAPPSITRPVVARRVKPRRDPDWLTLGEAVRHTGAAGVTINVWDKRGLLPNTRRLTARHFLYSRADLDRITAAPRTNRGVDRRALAASLGIAS
ncbi:MerR family transcriptional regulator [Jatrophihabitans sp.]|uniref:MerR family transcriptional regulator n=1 Tax=Jatrophihabitans sp. TaxID=1932789 RepID=UPI003F820F47